MTTGIDGIPQRNPIAADPPRPAAASGGGEHDFTALLQPAPRAPAQQAATPLASLAFVQAEVDDIFARQKQDREGRRHGRAMLRALGAVQLALLGGDEGAARAAVNVLAETARDPTQGDDPVLRLILREIGVRAAVELARHERSAA